MKFTIEQEKPVVPPKKIILEMNEEEADGLLYLVGHLIGNHPIREKFYSPLYCKLMQALGYTNWYMECKVSQTSSQSKPLEVWKMMP